MLFWMIIKVSFKSLMANKLRSILAMLGIIIGVGAVIAMLAVGSGAKQNILARFNAMGTNLLTLRAGQRGFGGVTNGTQQNLTVDDAIALLKVPGIVAVSPVVMGRKQVKYLSQNTNTNISGVATTWFQIKNFLPDEGAFFTDADTETRLGRVAVIGPVTATNLFGAAEPVGKTIKVAGINFLVIGTYQSKGDTGWYNQDDQVIIPYRTAIKQLFGATSTTPNSVQEIDMETQDGVETDTIEGDVMALMRRQHKLEPDAPDDVDIRSQADMIATAANFVQTLSILLGSVAGISLLVGGIGIMNIMLVTVTERTREIGVAKAIGAKNRDILMQFLIESITISGLGGLIGVAWGVGAAKIVGMVQQFFPTVVQLNAVILALGFSAAVGIFFGYYPATRAAALDPIEALRHE